MPVIPDEFGHCIICHKNMLIEQVIDGKAQKRFTPDYTESQFLLSDNSKMRVAICTDCKSTLTQEQENDIMASVIAGWQLQVDTLPWTDEKKQAHMDRYSALEIVFNADKATDNVLAVKLNEYQQGVKNVISE